METPQKTSYIFFAAGDNLLGCRNCGQTFKPTLPAPVDEFVDECNKFVAQHEDCEPQTSINMDIQDGQDKTVS